MIRYLIIFAFAALGYFISLRLLGGGKSTGLLRNPVSMALLFGIIGYVGVMAYMGGFSKIVWGAEVAAVSTQAELEQLVAEAGEEPVLVDFYATWCMPCKMTAPQVDQLAQEGAIVAVVDVDQATELAAAYEIQSIPTMLVFRNGELVKRSLGYHSTADLKALMKS